MRLPDSVWGQIRDMVVQMLPDHEITRGTVIKVDANNNNVYVTEFGSTPIPIVAFDYDVTVFDSTPTGVVRKEVIAKVRMPKVGDLVAIGKQSGQRRLPLCLGVVKGKNYIGVD